MKVKLNEDIEDLIPRIASVNKIKQVEKKQQPSNQKGIPSKELVHKMTAIPTIEKPLTLDLKNRPSIHKEVQGKQFINHHRILKLEPKDIYVGERELRSRAKKKGLSTQN